MKRHAALGVDLLARLEKRRDFLRCARGRKAVRRPFVLQTAPQAHPTVAAAGDQLAPGAQSARLGFTASRKIGNAVARNRAKRRLREAARFVMQDRVVDGHDYVLVARTAVLTCHFKDLEADLAAAMAELARGRSQRSAAPSASGSTVR